MEEFLVGLNNFIAPINLKRLRVSIRVIVMSRGQDVLDDLVPVRYCHLCPLTHDLVGDATAIKEVLMLVLETFPSAILFNGM